MTQEQIVTWLLEFGSDWVLSETLRGTWVWKYISVHDSVNVGLLDRKMTTEEVQTSYFAYRLTEKALDSIRGKP